MAKRYYILVTRDDKAGAWGVEFGSYDRVDVYEELECYLSTYDCGNDNARVVCVVSGYQRMIDAVVADMNKDRGPC